MGNHTRQQSGDELIGRFDGAENQGDEGMVANVIPPEGPSASTHPKWIESKQKYWPRFVAGATVMTASLGGMELAGNSGASLPVIMAIGAAGLVGAGVAYHDIRVLQNAYFAASEDARKPD